VLSGGAGDDRVKGGEGNDVVSGDEGDDRLWGNGGDDRLIGGADDDWMSGGAGDDLFVFADGDGADTVQGFQAGGGTEDRIDFSGQSAVADFADVVSTATQVGANTMIDLGNGDSVTLLGVNVGNLHQDDFVF
jgi:Ca2+-binding RTX toxin-like protein